MISKGVKLSEFIRGNANGRLGWDCVARCIITSYYKWNPSGILSLTYNAILCNALKGVAEWTQDASNYSTGGVSNSANLAATNSHNTLATFYSRVVATLTMSGRICLLNARRYAQPQPCGVVFSHSCSFLHRRPRPRTSLNVNIISCVFLFYGDEK